MENINKCKKCGKIINKKSKTGFCSNHYYLSDKRKKLNREYATKIRYSKIKTKVYKEEVIS